ncbi:MAG TPA: vWA domain-containing protein [Nannocystis sp.]
MTLRPLFALSAAILLAACSLETKLGELTESDETSDPSAGSDGDPTTTGADTAPPINSGSDDSGSEATGDSDTDGGSCTPVTVTRAPLSPNVVLVLDKSGSMVADPSGLWDHDADPNTPPVTRWSSLHQVVEAITNEFDDTINFGAQLFPGVDAKADYSALACTINEDIDIAVSAMNKDVIFAGIPAADDTSMRGGTPMAAGVTTALEHLKTLDAQIPRAILLVTDGAANCIDDADPEVMFEQYDESIHSIVGDAFALDGIPTYVVGVGIQDLVSSDAKDGSPDSVNTFTRLNELATDGGKPKNDPGEKFFNTVNQSELAAALTEIAVDTLTCIIPLDPPLNAPDEITVEVDGMQIPHISDCADQSGYAHPDGPFDAIHLCGAACGGLKLAGEAAITLCM